MSIVLILLVATTSICPVMGMRKDEPILDLELRWFHVQGAGASFANVLFTWACNASPDNFYVSHKTLYGSDMETLRNTCSSSFVICPDLLHAHLPIGAHTCMTSAGSKTFVGMFRDPSQRLISLYQKEYFKMFKSTLEMAQQYQGCYAKMLSGLACGTEQTDGAQLAELATNAIAVLHDEFVFVGIVRYWDMSVCLFHRMLGGSCHEREFRNTDTMNMTNTTLQYDSTVLDNWYDKYDDLVYEHARTIYFKNLVETATTMGSCSETVCSATSEHFAVVRGAKLH